jgi:hypothetical protein
MPKCLLLKHCRGGPHPHGTCPAIDQWAPEDVEADRRTSRTSGRIVTTTTGRPR